jgi:SAM-dependent methyltransferase
MPWIFAAIGVVLFCFAFVLMFGAPYVPTLSAQVERALDMIDLKPGETLLELGSGDGKVLLAAAQRGWNVVGVELNPILVVVSYTRTWRYREQVKVIWGDLWRTDKWPKSEGIFVFLLPKYMKKLDNKIIQWHTKPVKLVSFAFPIPNRASARHHKSGVYVYEYK